MYILILGTIIIHYWHPHSPTIDSAQISILPGIWAGRAYMLWVPKQTAHAVPQRHRWIPWFSRRIVGHNLTNRTGQTGQAPLGLILALVIKSPFFSSKPYLSMKFWRSLDCCCFLESEEEIMTKEIASLGLFFGDDYPLVN